MITNVHSTAPTQIIEVGGAPIAYRRLGNPVGVPLVLLNHYRAGMDHWDPLVTNGLAAGRQVILYDYQGVAGSGGEPRDTFGAAADDVAQFARAIGAPQVDVLGFSIGGMIALELARTHPALVRRTIVADAKPRAGETLGADPRVLEVVDNPVPVEQDFLFLFFEPSATSQAAGRSFWSRRHERDDDPPSSADAMHAQRAAIVEWSHAVGERYTELSEIAQPVLVVHGSHDIMQPTANAYTLAQRLPSAQLVIYPDSGHGAIFQYASLFVAHASRFLDADPVFTSCGVSALLVGTPRRRAVAPVAISSRRARSAKPVIPIASNRFRAACSCSRESVRRPSRRSHSP
jgi:pimeloyl-ACP methyl ester carboxylesterase